MPFLEGRPPRVIAHRGLSLDVPENTIPAFRKAVSAGADILETDVQVSKDGEIIVAHDPDLVRMTGDPGLVSDYTAKELAHMDLGGGVGFPTLSEVLEALPDQKFNIDLKTRAAIPGFVDVITQLHAHERVLIASFDEATRRMAAEALPGVATSATPPHVMEGRLRSWLGLSTDTWSIPAGMVAVQVPPTRFGFGLVTPSFVRTVQKKGLEVHVWTINEPDVMHRLWDMGVDGILTDRADLAVAARSEREGARQPREETPLR